MRKTRLDLLLMERGLAESRAKAQAIIMAGQVRVNGQVADKSSSSFLPDVQVDVDSGPRFVSRGGEKLLGALETFVVDPSGLTCVDVGASTGGFTDCLLQHGAARIYTIDVGKGILHWKIRSDPRVIVMEETNARFVESLPEPVQLVVCDASFISLKTLLPVMKKWLTPEKSLLPLSQKMEGAAGGLITLIKPQFEAGRKESAKHKGVIRDPEIHARILLDILQFALDNGYGVRGLAKSSLLGPKGNVEFLAWLDLNQATSADIPTLAAQVLGSPPPEKAE
ncbi:MAG: TlyA family RNA methyltransferase [Anaerolineae bacterium]|nr:TlyA family RNA methyltransferase [Anaerolineae bacterium]